MLHRRERFKWAVQLDELKVIRIISGGQTGADRAALDCAIKHDIPHGGVYKAREHIHRSMLICDY